MTEEQIKHMVNRFLGWRLPKPWNPDNGITFAPIGNKGHPTAEYRREPMGTNLFDATQAEAMVRYMLEGMKEIEPDWWWCDIDPDESGDSAYEAMFSYRPRLQPVELHSSYHGPRKWGVMTLKELPQPGDSIGDGEEDALVFDTKTSQTYLKFPTYRC